MVDPSPRDSALPVKRRRPPIPLARKLAYSAFVFLVLLGIPEVMLRLFWHPPVPKVPAVGTRQFVNWLSHLSDDELNPQPLYEPDSQRLWRLQPGARITSFNHHFGPEGQKQPIHITINTDGYRGQLISSPDTAVSRVLCLGDSNFFGYPLDDDDTFPSVLEKTLNTNCLPRRWQVINGGVPGYTVVQGQRWYEARFREHHFDLLLLSFLNNDAWRQPTSDQNLLAQAASAWQPLGQLVRQSRLENWVESWVRPAVPKSKFVPRVAKNDFLKTYRQLIETARQAGTRVMILDYRAYEPYEPYSLALKNLAAEKNIEYVAVHERIATVLNDESVLKKFSANADRVQRRWGAEMLTERPYLWYFAEFHPEHLSEVGVAWLTDDISGSFCREPDPKTASEGEMK